MNKVIIVGGVAGGATAAARIRRLDETAQIIVFEKSGNVSYANCGIPYYIGGVIEGEGNLILRTPESFRERYRIDVRVKNEVIKIDPGRKTVTVRNLENGMVYSESYDKLLLSPGAKPVRPELPGSDSSRIHTVRTVEDAMRIREIITKQDAKSAAVIGGGFIGLETAENLAKAGIDTTIVVRSNQLFPAMDEDMAHLIHTVFRANGVKLLFCKDTKAFRVTENGIRLVFGENDSLVADMVILAVGVSPDTSLAKDAGLKLGDGGGIEVDEHMQTSSPDIYAVGDAVEIKHLVTGQKTLIALAGPANKEARVAADNICGISSRYIGSAASSVIRLFDRTASMTGISEKTAKAAGIDYEKLVLSPAAHATYYPGAKNMTMKVLYEKGTLRILGCQIIGFEGVDKRIDVIATAMQAGMTITDLAGLDLAYAPPYSSAKDPVNMVGFMAENIENGMVRQFHWEDIPSLQADRDVFLLDTRTPAEYGRGHAASFINIPVDELRGRLNEIPMDKPVYVMCQSGVRSYLACRILAQNGYRCYNFSGGYSFYKAAVLDEQTANRAE
ncbi:MAG: FAD-dependent oxidoreductase [Eubacteriaceae bacterium]|nr:FAD-dependent oxidoreductase [Eubacteriaceae bacterium]